MDLDRNLVLRAAGGIIAIALIASSVVAIFAPQMFERYVSMLVLVAVPAIASFFTLLNSIKNSEKLNIIDEKSTQNSEKLTVIDEKASAAKASAAKTEVKIDATRAAVQAVRHDVAATASIVGEHVPAIAQKVEEIKEGGQSGHSGHTPPHGTKKL